jgi:hypothetical protein
VDDEKRRIADVKRAAKHVHNKRINVQHIWKLREEAADPVVGGASPEETEPAEAAEEGFNRNGNRAHGHGAQEVVRVVNGGRANRGR